MDFVSKYGFWIAMAAACVLALALHFVLVVPMAGTNATLMDDLGMRLKKLQGFARKKDELKNTKWIEQEKALAKKWAERKERCEGFFKSQPDVADVFRKKDGTPMLSASRWTSEFRVRSSKLLKDLAAKGIAVGDAAFDFQKQMEEYYQERDKALKQYEETYKLWWEQQQEAELGQYKQPLTDNQTDNQTQQQSGN